MIDAAVYVLDVFDWRRAGRPRELVRVEGRDLFTRPGGGVSIRAEALTEPPDPRAVTAVEQPAGGWYVGPSLRDGLRIPEYRSPNAGVGHPRAWRRVVTPCGASWRRVVVDSARIRGEPPRGNGAVRGLSSAPSPAAPAPRPRRRRGGVKHREARARRAATPSPAR